MEKQKNISSYLKSRNKPRAGMERKRNALDNNDELFFPLEIMFEILSWLPIISLLRFKCVCKRWNEIIQHPKFIEMHRIRSREHISHHTSKDGDTEIFKGSCCHGLLVERCKISGIYRVRNPATKQILALPDPKEKPIAMFTVFLESTNSYKLVYAYHIINGTIWKIGFKVLSFGGSYLSWRAVENSFKCDLDRERKNISLKCAGGFIYFFGLYEDGSIDFQLHCLDVGAEMELNPIIVPRSFFCYWKNGDVERWDGKVSITHIVEEKLHLRVLEDPIRQKWGENKIIPLTFLNENPDMKEGLVAYLASPEEIWLTKDYVNGIVYSIITKKVSRSQLPAHPEKVRLVGNATCTLVKLKGMQTQPKKKQNVYECLAKFRRSQMIRVIKITLVMVLLWFLRCLVVKFINLVALQEIGLIPT